MIMTRDPGRLPGSGAVTRVPGVLIAASHRRLLSEIEGVLCRADPRLASKFGMFGQLASDEGMPWIEQMTSGVAAHSYFLRSTVEDLCAR